jgi:predicted DNA-binding transcriptional regulator YafY
MRDAPAERLLRLARCLAGTRTGLRLDEMATDLDVGRRTAKRLRDSLVEIFPQMDIAALMEAEGIAMRPGQRPIIKEGVLSSLRQAILGMQLVVVRYVGRGSDEDTIRILCPYGLLHGGRGWLVAHVEGLPEMRLWRLDRIASVDLLNQGFPWRGDFSLSAYAVRSFGVFQVEPIDVILRFTPEAANDAKTWLFHPSQSLSIDQDGCPVVRLHTGGLGELCWHLITWETAVSIVQPTELRTMLVALSSVLTLHHMV